MTKSLRYVTNSCKPKDFTGVIKTSMLKTRASGLNTNIKDQTGQEEESIYGGK